MTLDPELPAKVLASGGAVLALSILAERLGPRVAGVLSGAPIGAVLVYFFVGHEAGTALVVASIPHAIAGLSGTLAFLYAYYLASARAPRRPILAAVVAGVAAFLGVALLLSRVPFSLGGAVVLTATAAVVAGLSLRKRIANLRIRLRIRMTPRVIAFRVALSTGFVVAIIGLAKLPGPAWAGLLVGFPMTLLPLLLILHLTYSGAHVHALIRNFPIGMVGLVLYLLTIPLTFPALGVTLGTLASLCVAFAYLAALPFVWRWVAVRQVKGGGTPTA